MALSTVVRVATFLLMVLAAPLVDAGQKCLSCPRDSRGRIARDSNAVRAFKAANPKPCQTCEVDHIIPLHRGGQDTPGNMQWLPREIHRDKTRREASP